MTEIREIREDELERWVDDHAGCARRDRRRSRGTSTGSARRARRSGSSPPTTGATSAPRSVSAAGTRPTAWPAARCGWSPTDAGAASARRCSRRSPHGRVGLGYASSRDPSRRRTRRRSRGRRRRGFVEVGRNSTLVLDLTAIEAPVVEPPEGIEIVPWAERPELAAGMYEVAREAYPDVPGEEDAEIAPFEQWLSMDMQGAGDRPEATFVAFADGEVVAYAKLSLSRARPSVAMHDMTGVLSARGAAAGSPERSRRRRSPGRRRTATSASRPRTRSGTSRSAASTSVTATSSSPARSRCAARRKGRPEREVSD